MVAPSDRYSGYTPHVAARGAQNAERLRVIETLLRLLPDVWLAEQGEGADRSDTRLLTLGADYRDPETLQVRPHWLELERCLAVMAHERNWQRAHLIAYFQAPTRLVKKMLPIQKLDRYQKPIFEGGKPVYERNSHGQQRLKPDYASEPVLASWISPAEAHAGLRWIEERYSKRAYLAAVDALARMRRPKAS
jgi:hypothetical protein